MQILRFRFIALAALAAILLPVAARAQHSIRLTFPRTVYAAHDHTPVYDTIGPGSHTLGELWQWDSVRAVSRVKKTLRVEFKGKVGYILLSDLLNALPATGVSVAVPEADPAPASTRSAAVQCHGTTKSGRRCLRMTTDPSGYCWQHHP